MGTKRTLLASIGAMLTGTGLSLAQAPVEAADPVQTAPPARLIQADPVQTAPPARLIQPAQPRSLPAPVTAPQVAPPARVVQSARPQPTPALPTPPQLAPPRIEVQHAPSPLIEAPNWQIPAEPERITRLWGSAEYLLWWVKEAPVPVPLVTGGPVTPNLAPVLGQPGTSILLGNGDVGLGARSGGRFTLGGWLDECGTVGLEGSYLFLGDRSVTRSVGSSGQPGSPFLALPFVNALTGLESSTRIAVPGSFAGVALLDVSSRLQGAELNGLYNLVRGDAWTVTLLGGFRYMQLRERLDFTTSSPSVVGPADVFATTDRFGTRNDFYGGQLGARAERQFGRLFLNATGKVALGAMHQTVDVSGQLLSNDFNGFGAPQLIPSGYFAQATNFGRATSDRFAVITDVNLNVGYQVSRGARVFAGYSFLYINDVVRPGNQIDRRINPTQAPTIIGDPALPGGTVTGPAAPLPRFNRTDFWAHGMNFGLELRY